jgi:hypothetical protein
VVAVTSVPLRLTSTNRFSMYGSENTSRFSRSASFQAAPLPSYAVPSSAGVNAAGATIVVVAVTPMRPSAASTRSSANRGCPAALVNGDHAVDTSLIGAACADSMIDAAITDATHSAAVARNAR